MLEKKILAKPRKTKIELIRDCMKIVTNRKTFEDDLEEEFKKLNKRYLKENYEDIPY